MDLRCGLNQILEMGTCEEVSEVYEFAVALVFDINDAPSVLAAADLLASNNNRLLRTNNSERNDVLKMLSIGSPQIRISTNLDLSIQSTLLLVKLIIIIREHLQVMESKLLLYAFLEGAALL